MKEPASTKKIVWYVIGGTILLWALVIATFIFVAPYVIDAIGDVLRWAGENWRGE